MPRIYVKFVLIILLATIGVETFYGAQLFQQNYALKDENTHLSYDYNSLLQQYAFLQSNYTSLLESFNTLNISYSSLLNTFDSLNQGYIQLNFTFNQLNSSYNLLQEQYSHLEVQYTQLNSSHEELQTSYDDLFATHAELNDTFNDYMEAYQKIVSIINLHVSHPSEEEKNLITPDDPAVAIKVSQITGGWSDAEDLDEFWEDVKKMYDWVVDHIEYRYDGLYPILPDDPHKAVEQSGEMWQFPNQTLNLRKGDCDDMAVLLTSMIYCYSNKSTWVECIAITSHMAVYIPVEEDKICILDPAGHYYTNTGFPYYSITSKDIQYEVEHWLDYWSGTIINPTVQWIFSQYIWRNFGNTNIFILWLLQR